jgi:hypothetical protein
MSRNLSFVAIVAIIAMAFTQVSFAQSGMGTTQNITATANVYTPLTTSAVSSVLFSNIGLGFNPVINPTGGSLTTAHVGASANFGGFTVNGSAGATITVSWSGQGTLSDGAAHTMKFTPALTTGGADYLTGANAVLTAGSRAFLVGGTLYATDGTSVVPALQTAGSYSTANVGGTPVTFTIDYVL